MNTYFYHIGTTVMFGRKNNEKKKQLTDLTSKYISLQNSLRYKKGLELAFTNKEMEDVYKQIRVLVEEL